MLWYKASHLSRLCQSIGCSPLCDLVAIHVHVKSHVWYDIIMFQCFSAFLFSRNWVSFFLLTPVWKLQCNSHFNGHVWFILSLDFVPSYGSIYAHYHCPISIQWLTLIHNGKMAARTDHPFNVLGYHIKSDILRTLLHFPLLYTPPSLLDRCWKIAKARILESGLNLVQESDFAHLILFCFWFARYFCS